MFKTRFISMLVLLAAVATGAWADTTVTWTASDVSGIYIDFLDGEANNNTIKGITVTSSGGGGAGASWESTYIDLNSGSTTITFTSSVGNIKSIAITAENIEMSSIPSGWTTDYSTLSWSGEASTTVPLPLSGWTEISGISEIVFTIESTVNVTGITLDKTEASMIVGGETLTLTPTVAPGNATDKTVTWTTSDETVATVTDGVVTAVAAGTATITVTTTDGAKTATCAVTVAAPAASTYTVTLKEGTEDATSWTIAPAEATTTGVAAGTEVKATYGGTKKVKSVKAKKKAAAWDGTITAQLAAKLAYTGGNTTDGLTTMTWAVGEHIAILYKVSGTKKVADAEITAVDGTTGAATITFTVEDGTPDNTPCTLVYPYSAAKDDHTGVKDAATLLAAQDGTLSANLDVRVGAGTIQTTTPGLTVTTQPAAQFAIFKFTTKNANGSAPINVKPLTVTIGAQNYVITPASATSELYVALPAVADQAVRFSATGSDSKTYTCSKASVTFAARKYYQSMLKMAPPITVTWNNDDITGSGNSFTKDGVTITAGSIDFDDKSFEENGTFTTSLGYFTKIEVVATNGFCDVSNTGGWSGNSDKRTWTGNASSVSFIGDIYGDGAGIKFVFTIEP